MSAGRGDRRVPGMERGGAFEILVDGEPVLAYPGETIAGALLASGRRALRHTALRGEPRGVYCAMGVCGECVMVVNGEPGVRTCVTLAVSGMTVGRQHGWASAAGSESRTPNNGTPPNNDTPSGARHRRRRMEAGRRHMRTTELAIVGAGPAGLAAAAEAARHGVSVVLFDDNSLPGGQYFRQGPATRAHRQPVTNPEKGSSTDAKRALGLFSVTSHPRVAFLGGAVVWGVPEANTLAFTQAGHGDRLRADVIIVAAGASDRAVPFPGWTLPGVITAGGAQNLLKSQGVLPGLRAVVAGTGPLLLVVADSLRRAGATVVEVLEAAPLARAWMSLPRLAMQPALLRRGLAYRIGLAQAGIPVRSGQTVIEARGREEVSEAVVAPIDRDGHVDRTRTRLIQVDTIVVGFGLTPATELTCLLGCEHEWHPIRGGWIPWRSENLETSVPGVFAVGDGAGIGGVETALVDGRLSGLLAAQRLGRCPSEEAGIVGRGLRARLSRLARFRAGIEQLYAPPADFLSLLTPETIVCRCEEVIAGQLLEGLGRGLMSINALKAVTRITMGRCQGRNCLRTLSDLVARERGCGPADLAYPQARPPARPVRLGDLVSEDIPPAAPPEMSLP
jgi:D-hydroxyproline dehydrogenase subunit alpha